MKDRDRNQARRAVAAGATLTAPLAFLLAWWVVRADLPDRIATHFNVSGEPDGFTTTGWFVGGFAGGVLFLSALVVGMLRWAGPPTRYLVATFAAAAWLIAPIGVGVMYAARGEADPTHARLSMTWPLIGLAVAALAGVLVWWLVGAGARSAAVGSTGTPRYLLGAHERAVWVGRASSTPLRLLAAAMAVVAVVGWFLASSPTVIASLVAALAVLWCSTITLRIDGAGLLAYYGPMAFPRMHVALGRIESAESVDALRPLEWGGWGFRITPRGTGLIVRGGSGIVVHRTGRGDLAISVDRPQQGVDLLRALQARVGADL